MSKSKAITLGSLTTVALVLICVGVIYWHNNTSGDFVSRANQTGGEIVNQIKLFNNVLNEVGGWLKRAGEDVQNFFTGNFSQTIVGEWVLGLWNSLKTWFDSLAQGFANAFNSIGEVIAQGAGNVWNAVTNWWNGLWGH